MRKLKADLHLHTREDPKERIGYNARELIELAHKRGFDVLSITHHDRVFHDDELVAYARERDILLIPGLEATIEGKHVLVLNVHCQTELKDFEDIRRIKKGDTLVIAPHPYFPSMNSLHSKLDRHIDLFDAIEYCHFYFKHIDFNKKAVEMAENEGLPLIGTSDAHTRWQLGTTYSLIEAEKDVESVIKAIKAKRVEVVTNPLPICRLPQMGLKLFTHLFNGFLS
jgi:predicted metal-dependent phosphoesterase TrpH